MKAIREGCGEPSRLYGNDESWAHGLARERGLLLVVDGDIGPDLRGCREGSIVAATRAWLPPDEV